MAEDRVDRWLRPRYVLPALGALLLVAILTSPESTLPEEGTTGLSSYAGGDYGALGFYEALRGLGIRVDRRLTPLRAPLDSQTVYALLWPPVEPSAREIGALLEAVRRGAGVIVVPTPGSVYADSLGIEQSGFNADAMAPVSDTLMGRMRHDTARSGASFSAAMQLLTGEGARTFHYWLEGPTPKDSADAQPLPPDAVTLLWVQGKKYQHPAIMGRRFGRGRVLLIGDPRFLRNATLRRGDAAVLAVRLLEWVDPSHGKTVAFDEFHFGHGPHMDLLDAVASGLVGTPLGRAALQCALAALILLLAASVRPIAPTARTIIERRSPLEHVTAASRAYESIGATRLAAQRLVRGLRRRHPLGATGFLSDDAYLARVRERAPAAAADAAMLARAILAPLPPGEFVRAGAAVDHIERTLTS